MKQGRTFVRWERKFTNVLFFRKWADAKFNDKHGNTIDFSFLYGKMKLVEDGACLGAALFMSLNRRKERL